MSLLIAQRGRRVQRQPAARGDSARGQTDQRDDPDNGGNDGRIVRANLEEKAPHDPANRERTRCSGRDAGKRRRMTRRRKRRPWR